MGCFMNRGKELGSSLLGALSSRSPHLTFALGSTRTLTHNRGTLREPTSPNSPHRHH